MMRKHLKQSHQDVDRKSEREVERGSPDGVSSSSELCSRRSFRSFSSLRISRKRASSSSADLVTTRSDGGGGAALALRFIVSSGKTSPSGYPNNLFLNPNSHLSSESTGPLRTETRRSRPRCRKWLRMPREKRRQRLDRRMLQEMLQGQRKPSASGTMKSQFPASELDGVRICEMATKASTGHSKGRPVSDHNHHERTFSAFALSLCDRSAEDANCYALSPHLISYSHDAGDHVVKTTLSVPRGRQDLSPSTSSRGH